MWNMMKTVFLLTLLSILLISLGFFIGGPRVAFGFFIFSLVMNFVSYWFSDKIVLSMYKAQEVSSEQAPALHKIVYKLCERSGLPIPKIYIIPTQTPNAFATGRNPEHAAVAVTEGIMKILNEDELEGVLAHELSHVKNRDILIQTIVASIAGAISFISMMLRWGAMLGGGRDREGGGNPFVLIIISIFAPIVALFVQLWISRTREFAADADGGSISGNPRSLASALQKLELNAHGERSALANQATAHMFIVNPFAGSKSLLALFSTHPKTEDRVKKLIEQAQEMGK